VLTTVTPTGAQRVKALFGNEVRHCYLPYDLPGSVRRFLDRIRPSVSIIVETEIWPTLYHELGQRRIPLVMASARVSTRSVDRYRRMASLFRETLSHGILIGAQTVADAERFKAMTGHTMAKIFRAPGGKTSPALLQAAAACGYDHVPWSPAGFLGDELPSDRYPNEQLLQRALRDIRPGDILLAHLGIWSRQDPWAPVVLEPLIEGLKAKGYCFATLRQHHRYAAAFAGMTSPSK
jgi:hypothetical protein